MCSRMNDASPRAAAGRPVLLLLPGLLCDASVWEPQRRAFAADYEVVIPHFWGFDSLEEMALHALELAGEGPVNVAGHSMGGRVALEILRLAPERLTRLALLDTGVHGAREGEAAQRQVLIDLCRQEGMEALVRVWLPPMVHPDRVQDDDLVRPMAEMIRRATPEIFEGQVKALLNRPDATDYLPKIACPTAVICGRQDGWSPFPRHEEMAAAIPGAVLTAIEDSGHMSTLERPEAVTAALRAWLARPA
jgi:pimeloyl-ACP methyl ester carboxylesterase